VSVPSSPWRPPPRRPPPPPPPPPPGFILQTAPAGVSFGHRNIPPPGDLYVNLDDQLFLEITTSVAAPGVVVRGRLLTPAGKIQLVSFNVPTVPNRLPLGTTFPIGEGFLLSLHVAPTAPGITRGQLYVRAALVRGQAVGAIGMAVLLQNYATTDYAVTWPPGEQKNFLEGPGLTRSILGTNPAAGVEISETVPTNAFWRLQSVNFGLTTNANVADRQVQLLIDDGAFIWFVVPALSVQAASLAVGYSWAPGAASIVTSGGRSVGPIPAPTFMRPGWRFRTFTTNLQAGDDYGSPVYAVEEWLLEA
jgi:hypothetical protein